MEPRTLPMTEYERQVHDSVLGAIFHEYRRTHGLGIARLVLVSYQMQLASSLSGAIRSIRNKIGTTFTAEEDEYDVIEQLSGEVPDDAPAAPRFSRVIDAIRNVDADRLESEDTKWRALKRIIDEQDAEARAAGRPLPKQG